MQTNPILTAVFSLIVGVFPLPESKVSAKHRVKLHDVPAVQCPGIKAETTKKYCVQKVTSVKKNMGSCSKYAVGDKICVACDGSCPETTTFDTDDGTWLRACTVTTQADDTQCKDEWPSGTCKSYVTLVKE